MPDLLDAIDRLDAVLLPAALAKIAARLAAAAATDPADDELLTVHDVARLLKVSKKTVYNRADDLGAVRLSRRSIRFSRTRVMRYVKARR